MVRIVAGCDGGGTSCVAWVAKVDTDGKLLELGKAKTGPANIRSDPGLAELNIRKSIDQAATNLALPGQTAGEKIVLALAGAGTEEARTEWRHRLSDLPFEHVEIVPDPAILFAAAGCEGLAVATIIGTGSIAWLQDPDTPGAVLRAGGLGPAIGDEGGGYWIGCQLLRVAKQTSAIQIPEELLELNQAEWPDHVQQIAALAPTVFDSKEPLVQRIVEDAAGEIEQLLTTVCGGQRTSVTQPIPWICAGGVANSQLVWLQNIRRRCEERSLFVGEPILVSEPVAGAIRLAARA